MNPNLYISATNTVAIAHFRELGVTLTPSVRTWRTDTWDLESPEYTMDILIVDIDMSAKTFSRYLRDNNLTKDKYHHWLCRSTICIR